MRKTWQPLHFSWFCFGMKYELWYSDWLKWFSDWPLMRKTWQLLLCFFIYILFGHEISCFGIKYQSWCSDWLNAWSDSVTGSLEPSINNLMTTNPKSQGPTLEAMMKSVVSAFRGLSTLAKCVPSTLEMKWTRGPTWNGCRASVTITGPWNMEYGTQRNSEVTEIWIGLSGILGHWNMDRC